MGAHDISVILPGDLTAKQVSKKYAEMREESDYSDGHSGYSGGWNTLPRLTFRTTSSKALPMDKAREYAFDHSDKWDNAVAVRALQEEMTKSPTFGGKHRGGISSGARGKTWILEVSPPGQPLKWTIVPADGLTDKQKARCIRLVEASRKAKQEEEAARTVLDQLANQVKDMHAAIPKATEIKKARATMAKTAEKRKKAHEALEEFEERHSPKLYARKYIEVWLIAGLAAS